MKKIGRINYEKGRKDNRVTLVMKQDSGGFYLTMEEYPNETTAHYKTEKELMDYARFSWAGEEWDLELFEDAKEEGVDESIVYFEVRAAQLGFGFSEKEKAEEFAAKAKAMLNQLYVQIGGDDTDAFQGSDAEFSINQVKEEF